MSFLTWLLLTLVLAIFIHVAFVWAFPRLVMLIVGRVVKSPINEMIHMPPTTSDSRSVVRPSPDLLYSAVKYDVSKRPLRITAPLPDTYWSISFFANNTDNFLVVNDRKLGKRDADFVLAKKGQRPSSPTSAQLVEARSAKGVILLRTLVTDSSRIDDLIATQKEAAVEQLER
jgi:uncharacterized membrane protein